MDRIESGAGEAVPPFVDATWLASHPEAILVDIRWAMDGSEGRHTYLQGHLPGAVYVELEEAAAAPASERRGRHPLPSPETFAQALGEAGIPEGALVVAYDQGPGAMAARLVWMLRAIGQPATVLDGGMAAWQGPTEQGEVTRDPVGRAPREWPQERLADAELTGALAARADAVVIDARDASRFVGETEPIDPRAGHIPGAVNRPFAENLGEDGRLIDTAALKARFAEVGALDAGEVVSYCGSGVTACHNLLVLEHLGVSARLYPGSWSEWSADPGREAATGPAIG